MFTIVKIDHDECVHGALNRWFDNAAQARDFLCAAIPRIEEKYPGSIVENHVEESDSVLVSLDGKLHTEFFVAETDDIFA